MKTSWQKRVSSVLHSPGTWEKARSWLTDGILAGLLFWWAWRVFRPLEQVVNIELYDESGDLWRALRQPLLSWPAEYGPLYNLWYRVLALLDPEPLRLYYHSYRWGALLAVVLLYLALRRLRAARPPAFWAAMVLLMSQGHARVWPRIVVFWAVVFALGLLVVGLEQKQPAWTHWVNMAWVLWWSAFVRPSMVLPALLLLAVGLALGWRARFTGRTRTRLLLWATALFPLLVWGSPYDSSRLILAFSQHFVVRRAEMGDPIPDPWVHTEYIHHYFTRTDSLLAMTLERPDLIWSHIRANLQYLSDLPFLRRFYWIKRFLSIKRTLALFLLAAWPGLFLAWRKWPDILPALVMTGLVVGQSLFNALLIYPHMHYLYLGWVGVLTGYALALGQGWDRSTRFRPWMALLRGGLLVTVLGISWHMFGHRDLTYWIPHLKDPSRRVASVARFVRQLNLPASRPLYTLGTDGEWVVYFGPQFISLDEAFRASQEPLARFLQTHRVDLIVMGDERLCARDAATCKQLLQHPEQWGYGLRYAPLANGGRLPLLIRQEPP